MKIKIVILALFLLAGMVSCGDGGEKANAASPAKDRVEVIYFHGKQRCPTCVAIEKNAKEVIDSEFAKELKNGKVVFRAVDISTPEGEKIADKYEVTWSSLYLNKWKNGKEQRNNLTDFGFSSARTNPEKFKKGLAEKIRESLK